MVFCIFLGVVAIHFLESARHRQEEGDEKTYSSEPKDEGIGPGMEGGGDPSAIVATLCYVMR